MAQQPPSLNHDHDALLQLDISQYITVRAPPLWVWHSPDMISGEYVVGAPTYNILHHDDNDCDGTTELGLILVARLLNRVAARTIEL